MVVLSKVRVNVVEGVAIATTRKVVKGAILTNIVNEAKVHPGIAIKRKVKCDNCDIYGHYTSLKDKYGGNHHIGS